MALPAPSISSTSSLVFDISQPINQCLAWTVLLLGTFFFSEENLRWCRHPRFIQKWYLWWLKLMEKGASIGSQVMWRSQTFNKNLSPLHPPSLTESPWKKMIERPSFPSGSQWNFSGKPWNFQDAIFQVGHQHDMIFSTASLGIPCETDSLAREWWRKQMLTTVQTPSPLSKLHFTTLSLETTWIHPSSRERFHHHQHQHHDPYIIIPIHKAGNFLQENCVSPWKNGSCHQPNQREVWPDKKLSFPNFQEGRPHWKNVGKNTFRFFSSWTAPPGKFASRSHNFPNPGDGMAITFQPVFLAMQWNNAWRFSGKLSGCTYIPPTKHGTNLKNADFLSKGIVELGGKLPKLRLD